MSNTETNPSRILRIKQIIPDKIPISKAQWYEWVAQGKAPQPIKISPRVTVWRESEVDAFIEKLVNGVSA